MHDFKYITDSSRVLVKEALDKLASAPPSFLAKVAPVIGMTAAMAGAAGLMGYFSARGKQEGYQEALNKSLGMLPEYHPDYQKYPAMALQRFKELSLISPTLATNVGLAHKVIHPRLKKGFSLEDIERLATIENKSSLSATPDAKFVTPFGAASAAAMGRFTAMMPSIMPGFAAATTEHFVGGPLRQKEMELHNLRSKIPSEIARAQEAAEAEAYSKATGALGQALTENDKLPDEFKMPIVHSFTRGIRAARGQEKKGSAMDDIFSEQVVSDECLGRMLATRHFMLKEAGITKVAAGGMMKAVGDFFNKAPLKGAAKGSWGVTKDYFKLMSVPLAIGLGFSAVNKLMQMRENSRISQEADNVFNGLKRTSDVFKSNPEDATEAFEALRSFAPILATKKMIAKTFVEDVVNKGGMLGPQTADMLASAQQKITDVQNVGGHAGGGFMAGLKEPMEMFKFRPPGTGSGKKGH